MKEIIDKITSYNLFNYLLPGMIFAVAVDKFTQFRFIQEDIIIGAFVYYFIGLVVSRFGSLVVEPLLKKISYLEFTPHYDFIFISKTNLKIETLSEANNMYRTFCSLFILLLILKLYSVIEFKFSGIITYDPYILIVSLLIIFFCSYRKQTKYITNIIKANNREI